MANLRETSVWEVGIYQLETSDPVMGGENGIDNRAPRQLANRTLWLKNELARQIGLVNQNNTNLNNQKADKTVQFTAGAGLTGGGDLSASRSLSLGTPSKITANSTNTAVSNTHSHEIDKASTTTAGIVQLVDNLGSNANNQALTAKQGKVLNDTKLGNTGTQTLSGQLITTNPIKINNPSTWAGIEMVSGDGSWILEANPNGSADRRLNFKFEKSGENSLYIRFPRVNKDETVAYQSWVQDGFLAKTANAASATKLHTPRTINGVAFDGTANITVGLPTFSTTINQATLTLQNADDAIGQGGFTVRHLSGTTTNKPDGISHAMMTCAYDTRYASQLAADWRTNKLYSRTSNNGQWTSWKEVAYTDGNVASATKLQTARNIAMTGDATWSVNFDGSQNSTGALTLANSGVTAGSYNSVTVDAKGRVTRGLTQTHGLVTAIAATGTANTATTNSNTFLNIVASGVGQTASVGSSTQITGTNGITVSSDTAGKLIISQTIANNLTDNSTTKPLSANMGKVLKEELTALDGRKFEQRGILGLTDLNSLTAISHAGIWHQTGNSGATSERHYPITRAGTLFVLPSAYSGQQLYFPFDEAVFYKRTTNAQGVYGNWMKIGGLADTLGSTSATDALTANQGKILKEQIDTKVGKSGNETIAGVKTFSSSPKAPTPPANSNDTTVATTAFVKREITNGFTYQKIGEFEIRKHPDGTMIQTYLFTASDNRLRDHEFQFNWAVGFAQKPKIFAQNTYKGVSWASIDTNTAIDYENTTQGKVVFRTSEIQYHGNKVEVEFMAIGRWK